MLEEGLSDDYTVFRGVHWSRENSKKQTRNIIRMAIDYLVYCPDYPIQGANAAGIGKNRIVDAGSTEHLARKIDKLLGKGEQSADGPYERVRVSSRRPSISCLTYTATLNLGKQASNDISENTQEFSWISRCSLSD